MARYSVSPFRLSLGLPSSTQLAGTKTLPSSLGVKFILSTGGSRSVVRLSPALTFYQDNEDDFPCYKLGSGTAVSRFPCSRQLANAFVTLDSLRCSIELVGSTSTENDTSFSHSMDMLAFGMKMDEQALEPGTDEIRGKHGTGHYTGRTDARGGINMGEAGIESFQELVERKDLFPAFLSFQRESLVLGHKSFA
ncbi:hypothetical protein QVD17_28622 [Tagetes erecta]|uniref:Uncharacterized protein n=1 Tax=Tagetes erecta TaxID=13708 RepID=A0AAD8KAW7_TARER|nr:hypothetical protein QVD17_28622 [Tagetes erecta]